MSAYNMQTVKIQQPPLPGGTDYASLHRSTEGPPGSPAGVGHFSIVDCSGHGCVVVVGPSLLTQIATQLLELRDRLADLESGVAS